MQVQELIEAQESQSMCPFYVDVQPQITELLVRILDCFN